MGSGASAPSQAVELDGYDFNHNLHPDRVLPLTFEDINARLDEGNARLEHDAFDDEVRELHTLLNGKKFHEFDESTRRVANDRERLFRR
ncbi:hypothetical protein ACC687_37695, partial [Rhizobium ruizarguesonis]